MQTYNLQAVQELLRDFFNLTGIKLCFYDSEENELCYFPEKLSGFCYLLRKNDEMDKRCRECDAYAFSVCKKTRKQYVYTCHAGLLECISPILYDKKIIGFIVIGQIKTHEHTDFGKIADRLPEEWKDELAARFENLPSVDIQKLNSAIRILGACTGYEYLKGLINAAQSKIDVLIGAYIDENLSGDLSVQALCSRFHLSHSEIYSIFKEYFHATPADFVKARRLNGACELLKNTALPVNKIAVQCGIPDYNYFSKIFKRAFAVSPVQYRKSETQRTT